MSGRLQKNQKPMKHIKEFLNQIGSHLSGSGPDIIGVLLNQKRNVHAHGKLSEYKVLMNTCKFKCVVYWNQDQYNRQYSVQEKMYKKNRRYIPSVDKVRNVINEELGLNTLIDYCLQNTNRLDSAQIYLIDRIQGYEYMVFKFDAKNVAASEYRQIQFKTTEYGNVRVEKMLDEPIRTDKIIQS